MDSILTSVKKLLGIAEDQTPFDPDIIMHINSVLSILTQLGIGPTEGFSIEDNSAVWADFISDDPRLDLAKTYVYMKVRLMFDPPISSAAIEAMNKNVSELEWRLSIEAARIDSQNNIN